ncbi:MAG: GNAT family N-acetyltransferase [Oculatellaceae cyanobacterium Prado106]|jgi:RimJ/RimL family protein N-acetyltransferase|nr:GNAT family N-acetyltransferase [Oculatellaceae cyanobacterium Prado106]
MLNLSLHNTQSADLEYVLEAENHEENRPHITPWSREQHLDAIASPHSSHWIIQRDSKVNLGYFIMAGLQDTHQSIELVRLVITEKGQGHGKTTLELIKKLAFETYQAHRLWLDVKTHNHRAQAVYRKAGFVEEGILRECLKVGDRYESLIIMSMLQQEYQSPHR